MNGTKRKFGLKHGLGLVVALAILAGLGIAYAIATGLADRWASKTIVEQLERTTGARVELGNFHFGWRLLTAESATEAQQLVRENKPNAALLDYMLPDGNGVELGVEFLQSLPQMLVIVMTGTILPPEEEALCEEHNFPVLRKPFLASDVMNQIRSRLTPFSRGGAA
jgi:CheY-like chemotaxis protein